jgi:hypothetical protein
MGGGGGIGGVLGGIGKVFQALAPLANFVLPGAGPLIANFGGQALQGLGNSTSKMQAEEQTQRSLDKRAALNLLAAQEDKRQAALV